jgi:hypothetical protein
MLPALSGRPIQVRVRPSLGRYLAATSIPRRIVFLDSEVLRRRGDFERILVHEISHFVWVRLSNARRYGWEQVLAEELAHRARGELGWSAEWRKHKLTARDVHQRSPAWRRYACESFCDTSAWRFSGLKSHREFTLAARFLHRRRAWFERQIESRTLLV